MDRIECHETCNNGVDRSEDLLLDPVDREGHSDPRSITHGDQMGITLNDQVDLVSVEPATHPYGPVKVRVVGKKCLPVVAGVRIAHGQRASEVR